MNLEKLGFKTEFGDEVQLTVLEAMKLRSQLNDLFSSEELLDIPVEPEIEKAVFRRIELKYLGFCLSLAEAAIKDNEKAFSKEFLNDRSLKEYNFYIGPDRCIIRNYVDLDVRVDLIDTDAFMKWLSEIEPQSFKR